MIREKRNKGKLMSYYNKFMNEGIVDPNVHPWVAESWQRCRLMHLPHETMGKVNKLNDEDIIRHLQKHAIILKYLEGLYEQTKQHLNMHNLSMLLIDSDGYVVKNYAMPFFQRSIEDIQGMRVLEEDIGTSSVSIALEHNTPFLMFGPEMWIRECHNGDACSAPITVNGKLRYVLTFFSMDTNNLPYDLLVNHLLTMKYAIEQHLTTSERWTVNDILMNEMPAAVFWLDRDGEIKYCNARAQQRMEGKMRLRDVFLNYEHIPYRQALNGQATLRMELTWITADRTYEDITSAFPIYLAGETVGVLVVTMSIEELKTVIAHATGYSTRYSLYSMVGGSESFLHLQHRASRIARSNHNILLQGEPGTGKQRMAHGIHQASSRAAGPLIVVKCRNTNLEELRVELFGSHAGHKKITGKVELANGGTLFLDEVEKLPLDIGNEVAEILSNTMKYDVRLIAACDSQLKKLTDKNIFSKNLYEMVKNTILVIPPLRERSEDIEVIAEHILMEMSAQHNVPPKRITPEAMDKLNSYNWPGNVKQLQGVMEKAFFHTTSSLIGVDDIKMPANKAMEKNWKYDKDAFTSAWKSAGGNISKLAILLGVSRVTLYRYLKKYDLGK